MIEQQHPTRQRQLTEEENTLLACVSHANHPERLALADTSRIDWQQVWQLATEQHVAGLIAPVIDAVSSTGHVPDSVCRAAREVRRLTLVRNMATHAELQRIGKILLQNDVPVVPLKGTTLALRLFGDLGARRCGDIDILVAEEHREKALQLLRDAGYTPMESAKPGVKQHPFHEVPLVRFGPGQGYAVELHWKLSDPHFVTIDYEKFWQRVLALRSSGKPFIPLPTEELLLFLALHLPKHDAGMLRLFADIHHLIVNEGTALDWDYLYDLARQWSAQDLLYFVLSSTVRLLDTPLPEHMLEELKPPAWKLRALATLTEPVAVLRPPAADTLRMSRFRIAYCLMLSPLQLTLRAYWHYIIVPPIEQHQSIASSIATHVRRPIGGLARTGWVLGSLLRDRTHRGLRQRNILHEPHVRVID